MADSDNNKNQLTTELLEKIGNLVLMGGSVIGSIKQEIIIDLDERLDIISKSMGKDGIDPFGMDPETLRRVAVGVMFLYKYYFRCICRGIENVPDGPVILVANHGGQIPLDGVMITAALVSERNPPRFARSLVDRWVPSIPFVSTLYSRLGMAPGIVENAYQILKREEALIAFPEGTSAISKTVDQAYQLKKFSLGFMRLALANKVPIVPVSVVGSEEQYPTFYNLKGLARLIGIPSVPIWLHMFVPVLGMLPLPVRYYIHFGEPMHFEGDPDSKDAAIEVMVKKVTDSIKKKIDELLDERKSIFL